MLASAWSCSASRLPPPGAIRLVPLLIHDAVAEHRIEPGQRHPGERCTRRSGLVRIRGVGRIVDRDRGVVGPEDHFFHDAIGDAELGRALGRALRHQPVCRCAGRGGSRVEPRRPRVRSVVSVPYSPFKRQAVRCPVPERPAHHIACGRNGIADLNSAAPAAVMLFPWPGWSRHGHSDGT